VSATEKEIVDLLCGLINPVSGMPFSESGEKISALIEGNNAVVNLQLGYPAATQMRDLEALIKDRVLKLGGFKDCVVNIEKSIAAHQVQSGLKLLPNVKNVIAVASGKGGVGKSTTTSNLALALASEGATVGILDADIYGPSQQMMMGLSGKPESPDGKSIKPFRNHGVQTMSIGTLVDVDQPMVWRGPMVTQALEQLLRDTAWDDLDYLLIDLPPGTGDIQLTLAQKVPLTGAVIVTTPQDIALLDAKKALKMFEKVNVPILGIIENMSVHVCSSCGHAERIFGEGGAEKMSGQYGVDMLGALPLDISIRQQLDIGIPTLVSEPLGEISETFRAIARKVGVRVAQTKKNYSSVFPKIRVENS